jgi:hypothetical protein
LVVAGGGEETAVRAKSQGADHACVTSEGLVETAVSHIPHTHGFIVAAAVKACAIRTES